MNLILLYEDFLAIYAFHRENIYNGTCLCGNKQPFKEHLTELLEEAYNAQDYETSEDETFTPREINVEGFGDFLKSDPSTKHG